MPLFDKVKEQAALAAQRAQEAGKLGQAKLDQVQDKRKEDALLRDLGEAVYAQRTGAAGAEAGDIERLVAEITSLRSQAAVAAADPAPANAAPEGDFKLD